MPTTKVLPLLLVAVIAIVSIHCVAEQPKAAPASQPAKAQTQPARPMMMGRGMMPHHGEGPMGPMMMGRGSFMQGRAEMAGKMGPQFAMERREQLKELLGDSESVGLMAIAAIRDEDKLTAPEKCKHLEDLLEDTGTLEFRNAIHLALKDLYKKDGKIEKSIEHLKALVAENDEALQAQDQDDEDEDDMDADDDNGGGPEHGDRGHADREKGDREGGHGDREPAEHERHEGHDKEKAKDREKGNEKGRDKDKDDDK